MPDPFWFVLFQQQENKPQKDDKPQKIDKKSEKPKKESSVAGAQDQLKSISHRQDTLRKRGQGEALKSKKKSEQNLDKELKKIKSSKDLKESQ